MTASLGYGEPDDISVTLATIMTAVINEEEIHPEDGILHHEEGVDLLPGNIELSALEMSIANVISREVILKEYIDMMREHYEIILIDCMPSLGMLTINALVAADSVLIPVQATYGTTIKIFENTIPLSVKAAEASAEGISIFKHCYNGKVSQAYRGLTLEVLVNEE